MAILAAVALGQCTPREDAADTVEELRTELESVREERDSLLGKLDASTRERVDLDGEVNRLRSELEALKKEKEKR